MPRVKNVALLTALDAIVHERRHSHVLQSPLARGVTRQGVMLHYDDSSRDDWAVEWFMDPRCTNGYTWLVLDTGRVVQLADPLKRTPHAGACLTPNANSAFYGIAAATNGVVPATAAQMVAIVGLCTALAWWHGWQNDVNLESAPDVPSRPTIVGHDAEAIWTPQSTREAGMSDERGSALWGKFGRKVDPTGVRADGVPVIDVTNVRAVVAARLLTEK